MWGNATSAASIRHDDGAIQPVDTSQRVVATNGVTYALIDRFITHDNARYEELLKLAVDGTPLDHQFAENCIHVVVADGVYDVEAYMDVNTRLRARIERHFDRIAAGRATCGPLTGR